MRFVPAILTALAAALLLAACGSEGIEVPQGTADRAGAELFAESCSGCHSMEAAGAVGSANRRLRTQGPNLDERDVSLDDALYAIRNGGFSGALMPQQIVTGKDAEAVAAFVAKYSGSKADQ